MYRVGVAVLTFAGLLTLAFGLHRLSLSPAERQERKAIAALKTLRDAKLEKPGVSSIAGLVGPEHGLASADGGLSKGNQPYAGYYFSLLEVPPDGIEGRRGRFAFQAYPVEAGRRVFCLVEGHEPFVSVETWPPDVILRQHYSLVD